jgi:hypothetical protein
MAEQLRTIGAEFIREFERMQRWIRNLRVTGDGVTFTNTPEGATAHVRQSPGSSPTRLPPGVTFAVKLTQSGGSNGTKTTAATYTYTVKDVNDNVLGGTDASPVGPAAPRWNGTRTAATWGLAYWGTDGTLKLLVAYEALGTVGC